MRKKNDWLKIICLAVGLTLGLVMLAKVCFIEDYNSCIPDKERVYYILENFRRDKESDIMSVTSTSGGVAPGMAASIPEIEAATRMTMLLNNDGEIVLPDNKLVNAQVDAVDTCFFDVFHFHILVGNPKEILAKQGHAMISRELALKLGGIDKAVGMTVKVKFSAEIPVVIDGVFETLPENCMFQLDMLVSISYLGEWSLTNWLGNDRYQSFARFRTVVDEDAMTEKLRKVQETNVDMKELEEADVELYYTIEQIDDVVKDLTTLDNTRNMMLLLGLALIAIAVLNYLVIVVSTLVNRSKEIAVYKCYGASFRQILQMVFRESAVHLLAALAIGAVLLFPARDLAETLLAAKLSSLFTLKTCVILSVVCLVLLAVTTIVPAYIFSKVPVAAAFRTLRESKRVWKLSLLGIQFAATAVIVGLLVTVARQYDHMAYSDRGYETDRLLVANISGTDSLGGRIIGELSRLPEAETVSSCFQLPFGASGNNVLLPGHKEELFNVADMYFVADKYFEAMGIPIVDGEAFDPKAANDRTVMVNREFVRKMEITAGWKGSAVGRQVVITEHSPNENEPFTIVGVFDDFLLGAGGNLSLRPMTIFFDTENSFVHPENILIRLREMNAESIAAVNACLAKAVEEKELTAQPFDWLVAKMLRDDRNIRDSLIVCSIAALIIAVIGLLGYTTDEVNRRRKEIAIRKVLGTGTVSILRILSRDTTLIAVPALALGSVIAYYLAEQWLQDYSDKIELGILPFALAAAIIYIIIESCVVTRAYGAASENPAKNLKSE